MDGLISIRRAELADVPTIARIWHDSWHAGHDELDPGIAAHRDLPYFMARAGSNVARTVVAERGGKIVGFSGWEEDGIGQVFVHPNSFRQGVGAKLLTHVESHLKNEGHKTIWLHCAEGNDRARSVYEKRGWRVVRTIDDQIGTHLGFKPVRSWHMEKRF